MGRHLIENEQVCHECGGTGFVLGEPKPPTFEQWREDFRGIYEIFVKDDKTYCDPGHGFERNIEAWRSYFDAGVCPLSALLTVNLQVQFGAKRGGE